MRRIVLMIVCTIVITTCIACTKKSENTQTAANSSQAITLYSLVNSLRIRKKPSLNEASFALINIGDAVTYFGETSDKKVTATINGKSVNAPFYKVVLKSGEEGWIFSGALTEAKKEGALKPSAEIRAKLEAIDSIVKEVAKLDNKLSETSDSVNTSSLKLKKDDFIKNAGESLHAKKMGVEQCAGSDIQYIFYDSGIVKYEELAETYFFFGDFNKLTNGIKPDMSDEEIITLLGQPRFYMDNIIEYHLDYTFEDHEIQGSVRFYLKDGKCFCIVLFLPEVC